MWHPPDMPSRDRWVKLLGLSAVVGVAAAGALASRVQRPQRDYERWEVTERLHRRHAEARQRLDDAHAGVWGSE